MKLVSSGFFIREPTPVGFLVTNEVDFDLIAQDGPVIPGWGYKLAFIAAAKKIEYAGRMSRLNHEQITDDSYEKFIYGLRKRNPAHETPLEFADMTVVFRTSRGISHEFVRHRLGSYMQSSTRYIDFTKNGVEYVYPTRYHEWSENTKQTYEQVLTENEASEKLAY